MIALLVANMPMDLDPSAKYRLELKLPIPGDELEYSSTPFFDLPDTDNNRKALSATPVLIDAGRFRTYSCIIRIAGMDLRGTLVVTTFSKSLRASISLKSFAVDVEASFSSVAYPRICCSTDKEKFKLDGYGYLPSLYNPALYGGSNGNDGSNTGWGSVVNWFDPATNDYFKNTEAKTDAEFEEGWNTYTRCVFPKFIDHFRRILGSDIVKVDGTFFEDNDISNLIMYSHCTTDNVLSTVPVIYESDVVYPYKVVDGYSLVAFNAELATVGWGTIGTSCRIFKPGYFKMTLVVDSPDGEFEFYDSYYPPKDLAELMPDTSLDITYSNDGTATITWSGFLEIRSIDGFSERCIAIRQIAGTPFTSGRVKFEHIEKYLLNLQGAGIDFSEKVLPASDVLPSLTIAEAITAVATSFCAVPLIHPATGQVQMHLMKDILRAKAIDISSYSAKNIEIEPQPVNTYKFSFDYPSDGYTNENSFKDISARKLINVDSFFLAPEPQIDKYLVDKSTMGVYQAVANDDGDLEWKWYTDLGGEESWGEGAEEVSISSKCTPLVNTIVTAPSGSKFMVPACKMEGISTFYKVDNREIPLRLLHWIGWSNDTNGGKYPFATSGQFDMNGMLVKSFSLTWGGENGLINTFWLPWLKFIYKSELVTIALFTDDSEVSRLISLFFPQDMPVENQYRFVIDNNVKMLAKELVVEFTATSITGIQIKALRTMDAGSLNTY